MQKNSIRARRFATQFASAAACWESPSFEFKVVQTKKLLAERDEYLTRASEEGRVFCESVRSPAAQANVAIDPRPGK